MTLTAVDTSAAIPFLLRSHTAHVEVSSHLAGRDARLTGHSLAETYAVLTRLPGDARVEPADASELIARNFGEALLLDDDTATRLPAVLAAAGVAGGAVYDGMVGLAAKAANATLVTRDQRAVGTYTSLGAAVEVVASDPESGS